MNIGILGVGEVGRAIKKIVERKHRVFLKDLDYDQINNQKIDVFHICISFDDKFEKIVVNNLKGIRPAMTIINSTIAPGATRRIYEQTKKKVVHVPIRGRHHNLAEDILKNFVLYIGALNKNDGLKVKSYLKGLGVKKVKILDSPLETELGKLLDTFYYAWNIIFCKWVKDLTGHYQANFSQIYTEFNRTYNQGYAKTLPHVRRPVLKPMSGPIGGHCIIPNAEILEKALPNEFCRFLLKQNKKLGKRK